MEYIGFSLYHWLKFKYLVKEKTKLNLKKRFGFCIKKRKLIHVKWRDLTSITSKNGLDNWIKLYRNLKNPILDVNHSNMNQKHIKNHTFLLSSTRSIDWCVIWLYLKKKIFWLFLTIGGTLTTKSGQFFFPSILVKSRTNR